MYFYQRIILIKNTFNCQPLYALNNSYIITKFPYNSIPVLVKFKLNFTLESHLSSFQTIAVSHLWDLKQTSMN